MVSKTEGLSLIFWRRGRPRRRLRLAKAVEKQDAVEKQENAAEDAEKQENVEDVDDEEQDEENEEYCGS